MIKFHLDNYDFVQKEHKYQVICSSSKHTSVLLLDKVLKYSDVFESDFAAGYTLSKVEEKVMTTIFQRLHMFGYSINPADIFISWKYKINAYICPKMAKDNYSHFKNDGLDLSFSIGRISSNIASLDKDGANWTMVIFDKVDMLEVVSITATSSYKDDPYPYYNIEFMEIDRDNFIPHKNVLDSKMLESRFRFDNYNLANLMNDKFLLAEKSGKHYSVIFNDKDDDHTIFKGDTYGTSRDVSGNSDYDEDDFYIEDDNIPF